MNIDSDFVRNFYASQNLRMPDTVPLHFGDSSTKNLMKTSQTLVTPTNIALAKPHTPMPTPQAPDTSRMTAMYNRVNNRKAIKQAEKEYDELAAATEGMGRQSAHNAGATYANRLMQQGMNPAASGVVAAQAMLPIHGKLAEIGKEKATMKIEANSRADQIASQIAAQLAQIKLSYSQTLADFNKTNAAYELDLSKFNATQLNQRYALEEQTRLEEERMAAARAAIAASGGGATRVGAGGSGGVMGDIFPGYIPNAGPITPARINGRELSGFVIQPDAVSQMGYRISGGGY